MGFANYTELQAAITGWLWDRDDLVARIPDFITLAEAAMNRNIRARDMETLYPFSSSAVSWALPADYREAISLDIVGSEPSGGVVNPASVQSFRKAKSQYNVAENSRPAVYTVIGNNAYVAPTPQTSYSYELFYYAACPALSVAAPTNWMLTKNPDAYLYGTLMQAAPYLEDKDSIAIWQQSLTAVIADINNEAQKSIYQRSTLNAAIRPIG